MFSFLGEDTSYLHMASRKKIYRYWREILAEKTTTFTGPSISSTSDFFLLLLYFSTSNKNWLMVRWGAAHCIKWYTIGMLYILLLFLHISIKRRFSLFFCCCCCFLACHLSTCVAYTKHDRAQINTGDLDSRKQKKKFFNFELNQK